MLSTRVLCLWAPKVPLELFPSCFLRCRCCPKIRMSLCIYALIHVCLCISVPWDCYYGHPSTCCRVMAAFYGSVHSMHLNSEWCDPLASYLLYSQPFNVAHWFRWVWITVHVHCNSTYNFHHTKKSWLLCVCNIIRTCTCTNNNCPFWTTVYGVYVDVKKWVYRLLQPNCRPLTGVKITREPSLWHGHRPIILQ